MTAKMLWPRSAASGPAAHPDLPESLSSVYEEAQGCLSVSPRAASALVRLTLEGVLKAQYPEERDLNAMIAAAARNGLPPDVVKAMDVLRFSGNRSIHELQQEDTAEDAMGLFAILNLVVERLITQPKQIAALHEAMPERVKEAIEKRDGS